MNKQMRREWDRHLERVRGDRASDNRLTPSKSGVWRKLSELTSLLPNIYTRLFRKIYTVSKGLPAPYPDCDPPEVHVYILPHTKLEVVLQPLYDYVTLSQQLKCRIRITEGPRQIPAGCIAEFRLEYAGKLRYRAYLSMLSVSSRTKTIFYWMLLRQDAAAFLPPYLNQGS